MDNETDDALPASVIDQERSWKIIFSRRIQAGQCRGESKLSKPTDVLRLDVGKPVVSPSIHKVLGPNSNKISIDFGIIKYLDLT